VPRAECGGQVVTSRSRRAREVHHRDWRVTKAVRANVAYDADDFCVELLIADAPADRILAGEATIAD
jgi:hypothetical protein